MQASVNFRLYFRPFESPWRGVDDLVFSFVECAHTHSRTHADRLRRCFHAASTIYAAALPSKPCGLFCAVPKFSDLTASDLRNDQFCANGRTLSPSHIVTVFFFSSLPHRRLQVLPGRRGAAYHLLDGSPSITHNLTSARSPLERGTEESRKER